MKRIDCFIPFLNEAQAEKTIAGLKSCELVHKVYLLAGAEATGEVAGCEKISIGNLNSSEIFHVVVAAVPVRSRTEDRAGLLPLSVEIRC